MGTLPAGLEHSEGIIVTDSVKNQLDFIVIIPEVHQNHFPYELLKLIPKPIFKAKSARFYISPIYYLFSTASSIRPSTNFGYNSVDAHQ